ncbi:MAG: class I SAM-dependent methyltransferase [Anaerolineales bacterium]|nr:class I SAM-dependent methyltransferase [Anaerolineales bacterium]
MMCEGNKIARPLDGVLGFDHHESDDFPGKDHAHHSLVSGMQALNGYDSLHAFHCFEQCRHQFGDIANINYFMAIALIRMNRLVEAAALLQPFIALPHPQPNIKRLWDFLNHSDITHSSGCVQSESAQQTKHYFGVSLLTPTTLANIATSYELWNEILSFHKLLATDEYIEYVDNFYRQSMKRFGKYWHYMDISNVLYASSKILQPERYLEIGVRRGRSVCVVSRGCPTVDIYAFDMWAPDYAGMPNPGPDFVQSELVRHGHQGKIIFTNGDSHHTLPEFFKQNPGLIFDLITVDGDHSEQGAWDDLKMVVPHLSPGGILVFDDISHPAHPYLRQVWRKIMEMYPFLSGYEYTEKGYGVAFAIRQD